MRPRLSEKVKARISKTILDIAEALPTFNGGIIHMFQVIRDQQRKGAERACNRSKLPEGYQIEFSSIRLIDFYLVEDLDKLLINLKRVFPDINKSLRNTLLTLKERSERISSISSYPIGVIGRRKPWNPTMSFRKLDTLPIEIDHISIALTQLLPSLFVITFDVQLSSEAITMFQRMQEKQYLPQVIFVKLIPFRARDWPHSIEFAEETVRREVNTWVAHLRKKLEGLIWTFFSGHFLSQRAGPNPQLPCIETHFITSTSDSFDELINPGKKQREMWLYSRGLELTSHKTYSDGKVFFTPSEELRDPHKLVVLKNSDSETNESGDRSSKNNLRVQSPYVVNEITSSLALLTYLRLIERRFEKLRIDSFQTVKAKWIPRIRLSPHIKLNDGILQTSMLLDRIAAEFDHMKDFFRSPHWIDLDLKRVRDLPNDNLTLKEKYIEAIDYQIELLDKHMMLIEKRLSQYLTLRNTEATHKLAIVVGLVTLAGVIGLDNVRSFIDWFFTSATLLIGRLATLF